MHLDRNSEFFISARNFQSTSMLRQQKAARKGFGSLIRKSSKSLLRGAQPASARKAGP
jgi:hypothetical protein